jgi:phage terminase large subunit
MDDGTQHVVIPYTPRPQFLPFHNSTKRWSLILAHRRAGKTVACINGQIRKAFTIPRDDARLAYIGPTYRQTKDVAWEYLKRYTSPIPGASVNETELRVDLPNGARIRLYGAENYEALRGLYLDDVTIDEAADFDPRAWPEVIRPALADRQGSAAFIGTPKGRNAFYRLAHGDQDNGWEGAFNSQDWFTSVLKASETGILPQAELDDARRMMTAEQYEQEFECSFDAAIMGAYYAPEFRRIDAENRIRAVPIDRYLAVDTAWDLGISGTNSMSIWFFQRVGMEVRVVDYYAAGGVGLDHYAKVLREKMEAGEYRYGTHYLPHDVTVHEMTSGGKSRLQTLYDLGLKNIEVVAIHNVDDGINATKRVLDRCWFDSARTAKGVDALRQYRQDYDERGRVFRPKPIKDWTTHPADAFRQYAASYVDVKRTGRDRYGRKRSSPETSWMAV